MLKKSFKKFGLLEKIELISALICICIGTFIYRYVGANFSLVALFILMFITTLLLIVFSRNHVYWQDKPLLTILSIYYKSAAYITIIFTMGKFSGINIVTIVTMTSMLFYIILSYVNEKKYYQMLNAYLYLNLIIFARIVLFVGVSK
jgi:hypothetical protein